MLGLMSEITVGFELLLERLRAELCPGWWRTRGSACFLLAVVAMTVCTNLRRPKARNHFLSFRVLETLISTIAARED